MGNALANADPLFARANSLCTLQAKELINAPGCDSATSATWPEKAPGTPVVDDGRGVHWGRSASLTTAVHFARAETWVLGTRASWPQLGNER